MIDYQTACIWGLSVLACKIVEDSWCFRSVYPSEEDLMMGEQLYAQMRDWT